MDESTESPYFDVRSSPLPYFIERNSGSAPKALHHGQAFDIKSAAICRRW